MNNLIGRFLTSCVRLIPDTPEPDGQGGYTAGWKEDGAFKAAIVKTGAAMGQQSERRKPEAAYTVTTPPRVGLKSGDIFRRTLDGAVFRVITGSEDSRPPRCAGFDFEQATAERWELT